MSLGGEALLSARGAEQGRDLNLFSLYFVQERFRFTLTKISSFKRIIYHGSAWSSVIVTHLVLTFIHGMIFSKITLWRAASGKSDRTLVRLV